MQTVPPLDRVVNAVAAVLRTNQTFESLNQVTNFHGVRAKSGLVLQIQRQIGQHFDAQTPGNANSRITHLPIRQHPWPPKCHIANWQAELAPYATKLEL